VKSATIGGVKHKYTSEKIGLPIAIYEILNQYIYDIFDFS
jgi:hypothetical protein